MKNSTRSWMLLSFLSITLVTLGYHFGAREGLLWGFALALITNTVVYFYGDIFILRQFGGARVEGYDAYGLSHALKDLAQKASTPSPQLRILPTESLVAFSMGRNPKNSCIFVSQGLITQLDKDELRAVLAFELASIKTFNSLAKTIASGLMAGLFAIPTILDKAISWAVGKNWELQKSGQFTIWLVVPLARLVLKLCIKNSTASELDEMASRWLPEKEVLAKTLWKLDSYAQTLPYVTPAPTAHLFMVNPLTKKGWTRYFVGPDSTEARIRKLIGYYPI